MGRVRAKGKKQIVKASNDIGGEIEEKFTSSKRRRHQKEIENKEIDEIANSDENGDNPVTQNRGQVSAENGRKRKKTSKLQGNLDSIKEENGLEVNSITKGSVKSIGFRQNGSRRKNKPRRAAEVGVGVECK